MMKTLEREEHIELPVAQAQKQLFALSQMGGEGQMAYTEVLAVKLQGDFNFDAMKRALRSVVDRRDSLRVTFSNNGEKQRVRPYIETNVEYVSKQRLLQRINASGDEVTDREINHWLGLETSKPFDLVSGPLFRFFCLDMGKDNVALAMMYHHAITDGQSMDLCLTDAAELYSAIVEDRPANLKPVVSIAKYGDWWSANANTQTMQTHKQHWLNLYQTPVEPLHLSAKMAKGLADTYKAGTVFLRSAGEVVNGVNALAQQQRCTAATVLYAAYTAYLSRISRQGDMAVAMPSLGRHFEGSDQVVGYCTSLLPLRVNVQHNQPFLVYLDEVDDHLLDALDHQAYPFAHLMDELSDSRNVDRNAFGKVIFNYHGYLSNPVFSGLECRPIALDRVYLASYLSLNIAPVNGAFHLQFNYRKNLFDHDGVVRLGENFLVFLQSVLSNPNRAIKDHDLLTQEEKHNVLVTFNATNRTYSESKLVYEHFEAQATKTPGAIAVVCGNETLTYKELNQRANHLARHLIKPEVGVGPDVIVGVALERSLEMVIAILAIWKAGGGYLPIDLNYPEFRVNYMLADSRVKILLSKTQWRDSLSGVAQQVIYVDQMLEQDTVRPLDLPVGNIPRQRSGADLDDVAVVIYTSGSTGDAKGAMNTHRGILNKLLWRQEALPLTPFDRILQKTSFSFDVSIWEIFSPLLVGARTVLAKPDGQKDPDYIADTIVQEEITALHFVPSMLSRFLDTAQAREFPSLKRLFSGGEKLTAALQNRVFATMKGVELHNLCGPAEAAIDVSHWRCEPGDGYPDIPIGRPIANTQLYVVDDNLQPLPIGAVGELLVGGANVARGYLNKPELTTEKFIANPFSDEPGACVYKTGDLCYWLPNGALVLTGRVDKQVKIRGFRVELGEIVSQLLAHDRIKQCDVQLYESEAKGQLLVAYVVLDADHNRDAQRVNWRLELKDYLARQLPEYMAPSAFVALPQLPVNHNGKIDVSALPAPGDDAFIRNEYQAPTGLMETTLVDIWKEILGVDRIGVLDNFFDLGGTSLKVIELKNLIGSRLDKDISVPDLFTYPSISALSGFLQHDTESPVIDRREALAKGRKNMANRRRPLSLD